MHLNKLSRLAITLSFGIFVQVVSPPKIVQAQIKPSVLKFSEQPNPPVTDKPNERVAASSRQQDPSDIERARAAGDCTISGDIVITTENLNLTTSPNGEAPVAILDATTDPIRPLQKLDFSLDPETVSGSFLEMSIDYPEENSYWKLFKERSPSGEVETW